MKRSFKLCLLLLIVMSLAACGNGNGNPVTVVTPPPVSAPEATQTPNSPPAPTPEVQTLSEEAVTKYFEYLTETYSAIFLRTPPEILRAEDSYQAYIFRYNTLLSKKVIINYSELGDYLSRADVEELTRWIDEARYDSDMMDAPYFEEYSDIYFTVQYEAEMQEGLDEIWGAGALDIDVLLGRYESNWECYRSSNGIYLTYHYLGNDSYMTIPYWGVKDISVDGGKAVLRSNSIGVTSYAFFSDYGYAIDYTDDRMVGGEVEEDWWQKSKNVSFNHAASLLGVSRSTLGEFVFTIAAAPDGMHLESLVIKPFRDFSSKLVLPEEFLEFGYHCEIWAPDSTGVPLRSGPGEEYDTIAMLPDGMRITELATGGEDWLLVSGTWKEREYFGWITWYEVMFYGGMAKPVIYLYPERPTDVSVEVSFASGGFTCTYPDYDKGWHVLAQPDGTLTNYADGREYSYLYWEGEGSIDYDMSEGFVVRGEDTAAFLQEKLAFLGLTPREYNEFIVYWLPLMHKNPYNLITFQTTAYTDHVQLKVDPQPDSLLRVYMVFQPLERYRLVPQQTLVPFEREGFSVIEWGGTEYGK